MAHHGGRTVPRAHRPRAPIMSVPAPLTAPLTPLRPAPLPAALPLLTTISPASPVTLQAPRPDADRATNEYVETPFRAAPPLAPPAHDKALPLSAAHQRLERPSRLHLPPTPTPTAVAITKQPVAFIKEHPHPTTTTTTPECPTVGSGSGGGGGAGAGGGGGGNIICSECGRCRCQSCRTPRALPQHWVCDRCLCSADAVIDYASCLCCVKGLFYHCWDKDRDAGTTCADEPCSCGGPRRVARWACLGALATLLPCLLCYWPLRGCQRAVEAAYARHSRAGCRCRPHTTTPEKRLLDSSPDY